MKQPIKIYLEKEDYEKLKQKAGIGRGAISNYISRVCREPVCFLSEDVRALLKSLNLK